MGPTGVMTVRRGEFQTHDKNNRLAKDMVLKLARLDSTEPKLKSGGHEVSDRVPKQKEAKVE